MYTVAISMSIETKVMPLGMPQKFKYKIAIMYDTNKLWFQNVCIFIS